MDMPPVDSIMSKSPAVHPLHDGFVSGAEDQIVRFERIGLQVVQLVDVPDAVIADVFVSVLTQRVPTPQRFLRPLPAVVHCLMRELSAYR
jgi:hypothetical protein